MTLDIVSKRRAIQRATISASLESLSSRLSDPEQLGTLLPSTFARLRRFDQGGAQPREPRVQMIEASLNRSEWLVWIGDDEKYHGVVELRAAPQDAQVEVRVSIDYEPTRPVLARIIERVSDEEVEHTLLSDVTAWQQLLARPRSDSGTP